MMHAVNKHIPTVKHTLLDALNEKENSTKNPKKKKIQVSKKQLQHYLVTCSKKKS